ncbi:hypothetical protein LZL87_014130 [Fusarium oxysporum]|nr:hypothetical protein LZL87_014130 [Fusarium oxysporum]
MCLANYHLFKGLNLGSYDIKTIIIAVNQTSAVIAEARIPEGINLGICAPGVLLYTVDTSVKPGYGPLSVLDINPGLSGCGTDSAYDKNNGTLSLVPGGDYETRQSHVFISQDFREVFSETTGNPGAVAKPRSSSKELSPSVVPESIPAELTKHTWSPEVQKMLKDRFRMKGFRHNQLEAINAILGGKDAFVLMPTYDGYHYCGIALA